jgi:hypothetical protein
MKRTTLTLDRRTARAVILEAMLRQHFTFEGRRHAYFTHPYNNAGKNERTVEVPLAIAAVVEARGPILEVGNVLGHYGVRGHTVVDRDENAPGVINCDIEAFEPPERYGLIVSVSTLEHVGWDEEPKDLKKAARVLARLLGWLAPGGRFFATVPMGYHPHLDALIRAGATGTEVAFLQRVTTQNDWREINHETMLALGPIRYGSPFPHANVIAVLQATRRGAAPVEQPPVAGLDEPGGAR